MAKLVKNNYKYIVISNKSIIFATLFHIDKGVVLEWLKRHAWKACSRHKRLGGSNPPHSARYLRK